MNDIMRSWNSSSSTLCDKKSQQDWYSSSSTPRSLDGQKRFSFFEPFQKFGGISYRQLSDDDDAINVLRQYFVHGRDLCRQQMVEYKALRKVTVRDLWKQGPHIFDVLAATRKILVSSRKDHRLDIEYQIAQLPCNEQSFGWLREQMTEDHATDNIPYILAVPVTSEVIEVIVNKKVVLPKDHVIPESLPHGVLSRQAAFQYKHRSPYKMSIPEPLLTTKHIIKDMVESLTLAPCPWSVVNNEIILA